MELLPEMLALVQEHPFDLSTCPTECIGQCPIMTHYCNLYNRKEQHLESPMDSKFFLRSTDAQHEWLFFVCQRCPNHKIHAIRCCLASNQYSHEYVDILTPIHYRVIPIAASQQKDFFPPEDIEFWGN
jgi:hypothetical protein